MQLAVVLLLKPLSHEFGLTGRERSARTVAGILIVSTLDVIEILSPGQQGSLAFVFLFLHIYL